MDDYISREAALAFQNELEPVICKSVHSGGIYSATRDDDLVKFINAIPAADVVARDCYDRLLAENDELRKERPVRHGRWIKARGSWATPGGDPVWECSECGKGMHVYGVEHGSYGSDVADGQWVACPNCGALMKDGDGE